MFRGGKILRCGKDREFYLQLSIRYKKFSCVLISRSSHHREII